ncbi:hypothetical protein HYALB_00012271 [Hymenoscyphus albidus]|uniref:RxLR effector protein n=1 Tax=Hymenoscyphus albidus TaxID=595503 RepID=A0A9N9Q3P5_9HELO|nr:hypothetical protein HYALB_00012271 [Hymenoscyphus albidus]
MQLLNIPTAILLLASALSVTSIPVGSGDVALQARDVPVVNVADGQEFAKNYRRDENTLEARDDKPIIPVIAKVLAKPVVAPTKWVATAVKKVTGKSRYSRRDVEDTLGARDTEADEDMKYRSNAGK